MSNSKQTWVNKIKIKQRDEIRELHQIGFTTVEIGKLYDVHHSSIYYYVNDIDQEQILAPIERLRRASQILKISENEIFEILSEKTRKTIPDRQRLQKRIDKKTKTIPRRGRTYQDYLREETERHEESIKSCNHERWVKRCSICNKILESDSTKY